MSDNQWRPQDFPSDQGHQQQQSSGQSQQYGYQQPYAPAPYAPWGPQTRDNSNATVALVLGIAAFATGILLCSPFAWWLGKKSMNEIDAAPGVYGNRGVAMAGYVMGIIGTVLMGLIILGLIALVVALLAIGDSYS